MVTPGLALPGDFDGRRDFDEPKSSAFSHYELEDVTATQPNNLTTRPAIMSEFKFSCPHCSQHLQCEEQHSGRQIQCPKCSHLITVPPAPGKTANFQPQSGMTWNTYVPPGDKKKNS